MKGILVYYSGSGNTKLALEYMNSKLANISFELFDIVHSNEHPDYGNYDVVGFATFTDFLGPPHLFTKFVESIPKQDTHAFVFNTYGFMSGKTLRIMAKQVESKGFKVITGHTLHTPENHVPTIVSGRGAENAPNVKEFASFNQFISSLDNAIDSISKGEEVRKVNLSVGLLNRFLPSMGRERARKDMGEKFVDESLCIECGICERGCPYGAITLDPKPVFDNDKCYGCWYCYNHCPEKAIFTAKHRGVAHYPKPNEQLIHKLKL